MKKLLLTGLLAALAVPATMSAMDDPITLTFNVTGTSVSNGVTVNVEGVSGVTATLNSVKVGDQELGLQRISSHADYLCNGTVNGNATSESSPLTYNFTIQGIPTGYSVDNLQLVTAACTATGGVQDSSDTRLFNTTVLVDDSELVSFGEIDIKKGSSAGLKTWFEELTTPASLSGTVNLTVSAYMPSGSLGCFFGLQSITFNYTEPEQEDPGTGDDNGGEVDPSLAALVGTYNGTAYEYDEVADYYDFSATIELRDGVDNGLKIIGLFTPFVEGYVNGTFNPNNNTISVTAQWLKDESGSNSDYYVYIGQDYYGTITFSVQNGIIIQQGSDYFDLYAYYNGSLPEYFIDEVQLVKGSTSEIPTIDDLAASYSATWYKNAALNNPGQATASIEVESNNTILISGLLNGFTLPATYNEETGELTIQEGDVDSKYSDLAWPMLWLYEKNGNSYTRVSTMTITVDSDKTISFKDKEIVVAYYTTKYEYAYYYDLNLQYKQPIGEGMKFLVDGISYTITSATEGNYRVTTTASEYSNMGANNNVAGEVVIPETVTFNGYDFAVTAIGKYSFSQSKITNLTIPASVTSIAYAAFFNCTDLQYVTDLATSPQRIGTYDYVFYGSSYNSAVLFVPEESVAAYKAATEWKDFGKIIEIGGDPDQVDAGDNFVYDGITYTVIDPQAYTVKTKEGAYVSGYWEGQNVGKDNLEIPEEVYYQGDAYTVVEIGNGSFAWSDEGVGIQSISIPDSVTTIGEGAFSENYNVTSVSLGSGLEYVGADAFYSADSLKEVSITAVVPPAADEDAFFSTTVSRVTLTVPALSLELYETAQVWKDFNVVADDGSTGINSLESIDGSEVIYNLNGVRVSKDRLTKGIYIINGKKVLVK